MEKAEKSISSGAIGAHPKLLSSSMIRTENHLLIRYGHKLKFSAIIFPCRLHALKNTKGGFGLQIMQTDQT